MSDFLICYHVQANAGYAIEPLEVAFYEVASMITGNVYQVHLGYRNYDNGKPRWLHNNTRLIELSYYTTDINALAEISRYISRNNIKYVLAFDLPVGASIIGAFRDGGVEHIFSYYGAPMSTINSGLKLLAKRIQVKYTKNKPDHFIFESYGMKNTATHGRGISNDSTSVVRLGIDVDAFSPTTENIYVYNAFDIPTTRKIIFYAGHMEKRKGVDVIVKAAAELVNKRRRNDIHFLICGNRPGEEQQFSPLYDGSPAVGNITFGGYRTDIPELMAGCYAAVIASTGWDSFPRTSLEMAAAGLPLLVSDLAGLNETIDNGTTGLLFSTGDHRKLADRIEQLADNSDMRDTFSLNSRQRVKEGFTLDIQKQNLYKVISSIINQ